MASATLSEPPKEFPQRKSITLVLSIDLASQEQLDYFINPTLYPSPANSPSSELQFGFIGDLFDLFNFNQDFNVHAINGWTHKDIRQALTGIINP